MIDTIILITMFFLSRLCRICIKSGGKLFDIYSKDYDLVPFSEKLEVCTKMIINKEGLSTQICMSCVHKLRVSYSFHKMCRQSTTILQGYLTELLSCTQDVSTEKFINSELRVTITPIPVQLHHEQNNNYNYKASKIRALPLSLLKYDDQKERKKRVSKEQRCSLLKRLLTTVNTDKDGVVAKKLRNEVLKEPLGGLKDLFIFAKGYDFGYNITPASSTLNISDQSPLDRLEEFSKTFFYTDFTEYRNTILSVLEDDNSSSDDMFEPFDEDEDRLMWADDDIVKIKQEFRPDRKINCVDNVEQIFTEPDINIKTEIDDCDENSCSDLLPSNCVQACYENEQSGSKKKEYVDFEHYLSSNLLTRSHIAKNKYLAEIIPLPSTSTNNNNTFSCSYDSILQPVVGETSSVLDMSSLGPSSLELLQNFAAPRKAKTFYPHSLKCRTRGQPFINPQLKEQFQMRSFKCNTCNRRFKSPGYLHSHCTKMGH